MSRVSAAIAAAVVASAVLTGAAIPDNPAKDLAGCTEQDVARASAKVACSAVYYGIYVTDDMDVLFSRTVAYPERPWIGAVDSGKVAGIDSMDDYLADASAADLADGYDVSTPFEIGSVIGFSSRVRFADPPDTEALAGRIAAALNEGRDGNIVDLDVTIDYSGSNYTISIEPTLGSEWPPADPSRPETLTISLPGTIVASTGKDESIGGAIVLRYTMGGRDINIEATSDLTAPMPRPGIVPQGFAYPNDPYESGSPGFEPGPSEAGPTHGPIASSAKDDDEDDGTIHPAALFLAAVLALGGLGVGLRVVWSRVFR